MDSASSFRRGLGRVGVVVGVGLIGLSVQTSPVGAEGLLQIPVDEVVTGPEGSEALVGSAVVPAEYVGRLCDVFADVRNQESVHPGNDLIISAGGERSVIANFESDVDQVTTGSISVTMGESVDVYLRFGPDGISSGGFSVSIDCASAPPAPTTSVLAVAPSTLAPSTTATTAPEPAGPVVTGPSTTIVSVDSLVVPAAPTQTPTTAAPTTTTPASGASLPVTGGNARTLAVFGGSLFAAGLLLRAAANRRQHLTG